jgi:hypothetical protein
MDTVELSVEQCRTLARIRATRPDAEVTLHGTRAGLVVEVRRGMRVELARLEASGHVLRDQPLALAG